MSLVFGMTTPSTCSGLTRHTLPIQPLLEPLVEPAQSPLASPQTSRPTTQMLPLFTQTSRLAISAPLTPPLEPLPLLQEVEEVPQPRALLLELLKPSTVNGKFLEDIHFFRSTLTGIFSGGQGYAGPTVCAAGTTCHVTNEYYSQCY